MTAQSPLPVLDLGHLSAMTGGDTDLSLEVIEIFRHQAQLWSRLLDPQGEASQWADAAHTLKGASLGIGALKLAASCERAELPVQTNRTLKFLSVMGAILLSRSENCGGQRSARPRQQSTNRPATTSRAASRLMA